MGTTYRIYNLQLPFESIEVGVYRFTRVPEYQDRITRLYRHAKTRDDGTIISSGQYGSHQHTFNATLTSDTEPIGVLYWEESQIKDIALLLRFYLAQPVYIEKQVNTASHRLAVFPVLLDREIPVVNQVLAALPSLNLRQLGIPEATKMYLTGHESFDISANLALTVASFEILANQYFVCADEGQTPVILSNDVLEEIREFARKKLEQLQLDKRDIRDKILANIAHIGEASLRDKINFLIPSILPEMKNVPERKMEDAIKIFVQFRNDLLHRAKSPRYPQFEDQEMAFHKANYHLAVFETILKLTLARLLGTPMSRIQRIDIREVQNYLTCGVYRGTDTNNPTAMKGTL